MPTGRRTMDNSTDNSRNGRDRGPPFGSINRTSFGGVHLPDELSRYGGVMGARLRTLDWAVTPLGPPQGWPQSLRTALSIMLNSAFPTFMAWGPELTSFYNDAYIPIMGDKPDGMGRPFAEIWAEVWDTLGPFTERAMRGEASYFEDLPLTLKRNGFTEETWFTFSYSPIRDETGGVGGVLCTVYETTNRVRAEAALRKSEERLHAATELVGLSTYEWDPATGALSWDTHLKTMWGLSAETDVDHDIWLSAIHPEDRQLVDAAVVHSLDPSGDGVYHIEYRVIGINDGEERWVSTHGRTTFVNGQPMAFIGAAIEITERKQIEAALRESELRLAAMLEQLPVGVGLTDARGEIILANTVMAGYALERLPTQQENQAQRWRAYAVDGHPLSLADYPGARALRGETVVPGTDFLFTAADGRETWARVSAAPFHDEADQTLGAILVVQDIDREKRTDESFRGFATHSSNVLWIVDTTAQTIQYLNPAFETVFGALRDDVLDDRKRLVELVHSEDRESVESALNKAATGTVAVEEFRIVRPDGGVRWIRNTFFPIRDDHGEIQRAGGIAQDITRRAKRFVYVVDGAESLRNSLANELQSAGYDVRSFPSGSAFLDVAPALASGCVVIDMAEPQAGGLGVLRALKSRRVGMPVIVLGDAQNDPMLGVKAMKAGASDFLPVPYALDDLLVTVASAMADVRDSEDQEQAADRARAGIAEMSAREREVLDGLLAGKTNKEIGRDVGISPRTVETHRAHVMQRLGVQTLPQAVLLAAAVGLRPPPRRPR